jgi:hypothetical protein
MIKRLIHDRFHIIPAIIPRPISALDSIRADMGVFGVMFCLIFKLFMYKECYFKGVIHVVSSECDAYPSASV